MDEVKELVEVLTRLRDAYYNGEPEVSDADYDDLEDKLRELDPNNEFFSKVGEDSDDGFPKAKHVLLMGSQDKCNTVEEIVRKLKHFFGKKIAFMIEPKCDGISLEMNYQNGKLVSCITRGDGYVGDDITANASKMQGVPSEIPTTEAVSTRGEILLFHSDKDKYFPDLKNCRNGASGISKNKEGTGCEHLTVVTYDAQYLNEDLSFETEANKLDFLENNGFVHVNTSMLIADCTTDAGIQKAAEDLMAKMNEFTIADREYDTDGVVVKLNVIDENDIRTEIKPKTQWAIKPARVEVETTLIDIEWNMTNGRLVPVAIFEPVILDGATIQRASLVNVAEIERLGLYIGAKIIVSRRNMVIPKVERLAA